MKSTRIVPRRRVNRLFYPLVQEELLWLKEQKLVNSFTFVYLALRLENPYADRPVKIQTKEFVLRWGIPESTLYAALAKLRELKALVFNSKTVEVQWQQDFDIWESPLDSQKDKLIDSQQDGDSRNLEKILGSKNLFQDSREDSRILESQSVEPSTDVASASLQNTQSNLDLTDNEIAEKKLFGEEEEKEASQGADDSGILQESQESTGILEEPRPDPITEAQQATLQMLDEREIFDDLRRLGIELNEGVRATMKKFKANVPDAIAHIKQRYNNRHERFKNITGAFVKACQEGAKPQLTTRSQVKPPTIEQMCQLEQAKVAGTIRDFYLAPCGSDREAVLVDTGSAMMPWWEFLA